MQVEVRRLKDTFLRVGSLLFFPYKFISLFVNVSECGCAYGGQRVALNCLFPSTVGLGT